MAKVGPALFSVTFGTILACNKREFWKTGVPKEPNGNESNSVTKNGKAIQ